MKVAIFAVEYKAKNFDNSYRDPIPREFRSECRNLLFDELIEWSRDKGVRLTVLPGGFFRTNRPGGIANGLKHCPPKINVLVGWDNILGDKREVWVVAKNGSITKRIPEAYNKNKADKGRSELKNISDRRFQIDNKMYSAYCCGDIIINERKFTYSNAAFILAHSSAPGRSFTPAMRKLAMPAFLSHHVKWPSLKNNEYFAYKGRKPLRPIDEFENKKSQKPKWIARIYSI